MAKHELTPADIMSMETYGKIRLERRRQVRELKKNRRIAVGPVATFYFENYQTMWHQVHEMLFIEKGGAEQIADELAAYNPLIPKGRDLVATLMFEIDDAERRDRFLSELGHVETMVTISFDGESIEAVPEGDTERTDEGGKTSSVHFLHFPFSDLQVEKFRGPGARATVAINHENYGHAAKLSPAAHAALAEDFD